MPVVDAVFGPYPSEPTKPMLVQLSARLHQAVGVTLVREGYIEGFKIIFKVEVEDAIDPNAKP
jgi:hypothetical protein